MSRHPLQEKLIDAAFITGPRRKMVEDLAMAILRHHRPEPAWSPFTGSYSRWECVGHFDAQENQHSWPCDEVEDLARALGVPL